jgi:hypothetical protein
MRVRCIVNTGGAATTISHLERNLHRLVRRGNFHASSSITCVCFRQSSGARGARNPSAFCVWSVGQQAAPAVLSLSGRACAVSALAHRAAALRHTGARPAAHLTSPTLSTGVHANCFASISARASYTRSLAGRCRADWHWPN